MVVQRWATGILGLQNFAELLPNKYLCQCLVAFDSISPNCLIRVGCVDVAVECSQPVKPAY